MYDPPAIEFKDRSVRLTLFGAMAVMAGVGCLVLGLAHILLLFWHDLLPGLDTMPVDLRSSVMGALIYALLGLAFVWVGSGSIRKRRWARPLMLTLAWTWLAGGVTALVLLPALLEMSLGMTIPGAQMDSDVVWLIKLVSMLGIGLLGVVLPGLFVWAYNDRHLRLTCEAHDTQPDWTQGCPPAVLGLSVGLGACGLVLALMALRPAVPWFGRLVTGWPGALMFVLGGGVSLWLAREIYALRVRGWWVASVFLIVGGVSTWLTLVRIEPAEMFRAMGYPEELLPSGSSAIGRVTAWLTIFTTLATLGYMASIRKHFSRRS
jgi:hypothetical protein